MKNEDRRDFYESNLTDGAEKHFLCAGGSFRCAVKAKAPIVPFAFVDSFKVLDQKGSKPVAVQLHYLPVIPYEEYKDMNTVEIADMVKSRIQAVLDEYA